MDIALGDPAENRRRAGRLVRQAAGAQPRPDVVVLPEAWTTAYDLGRLGEIADPPGGGATAQLLSGLAREMNIAVVGGSAFEEIAEDAPAQDPTADRRYANVARCFDRLGRQIAEYRKIHLFRLMDEHHFITAGTAPCRFDLPAAEPLGGTAPAGLIICYDLRFPELARTLALDGAQVLFVVAQWPASRAAHWRALNIARAIENQMYVVACNRVGRKGGSGTDADEVFGGGSLIVGPRGDVLAEGDGSEGVITAELDLRQVADSRRQIPIFADRAPQAYRL